MTSPFDDADAPYLVLVNDEKQHSRWPADIASRLLGQAGADPGLRVGQ